MKNVDISVVIPVYNATRFIERCVSSVLNQTFTDYEVLLIDDCSTDDSYNKCCEIAAGDARIKCLRHSNNKGASAARNYGIRESLGDYIIFIDSDDYWIEEDMLEHLWSVVNKEAYPDFLLFNRVNINEKGICHKWKEMPQGGKNGFSKESPLYEMTRRGIFPVSTGMKIYKRDFLVSNNFFFKEGVVWEDVLFYFQVIHCSRQYRVLTNYYYAACYNSGSVSRNNSEIKVTNLFTVIKDCLKISIKEKDQEYVLYSIMAYYYAILLSQLQYVKNKDIINEVFLYQWLLDYTLYRPLAYVSVLKRIIGVRNVSKLLSLYGDHKH